MSQLVLIRHGESIWNKENLFTGWADVDLSENGHKEAANGGKELKKEGFSFDICYTSYLKRAIHTANHVLEELDEEWIPVIKTWKLNERHYGALQGLNKSETAEKYGEDQVKIWRRSFDVTPPELEESDDRNPANQTQYAGVDKKDLPLTESLKITIDRVVPYYKEVILPDIKAGKKVLIAAHGNSLRALVKYLDNISDEDILNLNIPTAVPLVYELDDDCNAVSHRYLGDQAAIEAAMQAVANQGKKS
ncbi:MAG: 2,3-diphosphoglycerate-dependent phosphoglycerate mutase [Lachnospiraceae bacterium]|nr:2,3-diphosphoglycerate-dependent phosphoglycerate mutase [Lachnospiraceae bacterium]